MIHNDAHTTCNNLAPPRPKTQPGEGGVSPSARRRQSHGRRLARGNFGAKEVGLTYNFGEVELAAATGIHAGQFTRVRKSLKQGLHWDLNKLRVAYSKNGAETVLASLKLTATEIATALAKADLEKKTPAPPVTGCLTKFFANPRLIQVTLTDGTPVNVRVKNTLNLKRGMECPLRWLDAEQRFELARRLPRFPGRW